MRMATVVLVLPERLAQVAGRSPRMESRRSSQDSSAIQAKPLSVLTGTWISDSNPSLASYLPDPDRPKLKKLVFSEGSTNVS